MKFVFIAKHRSIWPVAWLCNALGVSRSGFHAWLNRTASARSRSDEVLGQRVKASFVASDRTYGARRVWHDMLAEGEPRSLYRTAPQRHPPSLCDIAIRLLCQRSILGQQWLACNPASKGERQ